MKVRLEDGKTWKTAYSGKSIDLPEKIGIANGFEKVEKQLEPKQSVPVKSKEQSKPKKGHKLFRK